VLTPFNRQVPQRGQCFAAYGNLAGRSGQRRKTVKTFKKIILGSALAASSLAIAAPASAQDYNRYRHHNGDGATAAVVGGVIGLALGVAIASSNRGYDSYRNGTWYEGYQYRNGGFYDRQGYRRYDRETWQHRHYRSDRRDGYRSGYDQRDGYGYQGQYDNGYGGYDGRSYDGGGYQGGGNYPRGY
jgi:hypothetical protein